MIGHRVVETAFVWRGGSPSSFLIVFVDRSGCSVAVWLSSRTGPGQRHQGLLSSDVRRCR